ncbi:MAG: FAD-dependent oxidoreductase [Actinobacteria bacterium]|nr:FAD-dependent oxidoreductase [Actinomycetota bacterium]
MVGGGLTGLWTAVHAKLSDPAASVVLLEAGVCGGGASGRNGGFLMTAWSKFGSLAKIAGVADALAYSRAVEDAVGEIGEFCTEYAIEAEFNQAGWVWTATNTEQVGTWEQTSDALAAIGASPYRALSREETAAMTGSPVHLAGVFEAAAGTVNPARLVRGLRRVALQLGVAIRERTAVLGVESSRTRPTLVTSGGSIDAGTVVLATSAWTATLAPLDSQLVVLGSDVVATDPIAERLEALGLRRGISISDSRRTVHYYRVSEDGRLIFGKGGGGVAPGRIVGRRFERSARRAEEVRRHLRRIYPSLWDVPVPHDWRGAVDYSLSGLPFVGRLHGQERVLVAAGFSGNGLTPSYVAGRDLARMALGRDRVAVPEALGRTPGRRLPPEPLLFVGGEIVRRAVERKERAEDEGRVPSRAARAVASLDPTSFVDGGGTATKPSNLMARRCR